MLLVVFSRAFRRLKPAATNSVILMTQGYRILGKTTSGKCGRGDVPDPLLVFQRGKINMKTFEGG
jgi:hypothetical protein